METDPTTEALTAASPPVVEGVKAEPAKKRKKKKRGCFFGLVKWLILAALAFAAGYYGYKAVNPKVITPIEQEPAPAITK